MFSCNRWRVLWRRSLSRKRLVQFHTAPKLLLRAHNEAACQRLGRLVGSAETIPDCEIFAAYEADGAPRRR